MVGMDDRVETRRMTKESGKSSSRKATRERERGDWIESRGHIPTIYICVCIYIIYIYIICVRGRKRRERSRDNGCARVYTRMSGVSRIYAYSGLVM